MDTGNKYYIFVKSIIKYQRFFIKYWVELIKRVCFFIIIEGMIYFRKLEDKQIEIEMSKQGKQTSYCCSKMSAKKLMTLLLENPLVFLSIYCSYVRQG